MGRIKPNKITKKTVEVGEKIRKNREATKKKIDGTNLRKRYERSKDKR